MQRRWGQIFECKKLKGHYYQPRSMGDNMFCSVGRSVRLSSVEALKRPAEKMQFPKLHFGPGLFDLERSKVNFFYGLCPP